MFPGGTQMLKQCKSVFFLSPSSPPACFEQGVPHVSDVARHSGAARSSPAADGETDCLKSEERGLQLASFPNLPTVKFFGRL